MTTTPSPKPDNNQDSAQRDAERLKHRYPLSFLMKLLGLLLALFLILCIVLYAISGTEKGTKFIIEKIISETGVDLEYGSGNFRDGLLVKDITLSASENVDVHFLNTYVKIGWRAMFSKEVHLRDAKIDSVVIENRQPPSGEPFKYKTYELPVDLRFDRARIDKIIYNQVGREPVKVFNVKADDLLWIGTELEVDNANFEVNEMVKIKDLEGSVNLKNQYPLDLKALVTVNSLEKIYVDPISVNAVGSLKRTYGQIRSRYNNSNVRGEFTVQGLDKNAPLDAKLFWDEVDIPYAESQEIILQNGVATLSGVLSDIELRINSRLLAKDVPSGIYKGRANIVDTNKMLVEQLSASTPEGNLLAKGVLNWEDQFNIKAMLYSNDYKVGELLPEVAAPYAPSQINGRLAFLLNTKNKNGLMQIDTVLQQRDGERIQAKVVRGNKNQNQDPDNPQSDANADKSPWFVDASWKNLVRQNVPNIGNINSPEGFANIVYQGNRLSVDADAQIKELNAAPIGNYKVRLNKVSDTISLNDFSYEGVIGKLVGNGQIKLENDERPLTWKVNAQSSDLSPQAWNQDIPIARLVGDIQASGKMIDISRRVNGKRVSGKRHSFTIKSTDLNTTLTTKVETGRLQAGDENPNIQNANRTNDAINARNTENRFITINGGGDGIVDIYEGKVDHFDARFDGQMKTQGVPNGNLSIDVNGTANNINIETLEHRGEAGGISASGNVDLSNGIKWNVSAEGDKFNVGYFLPQTQGIVTGKLNTSGHWLSDQDNTDKLKAFDVKFDGILDTPQLPQGKLEIDAGGNGKSIAIKKLSHKGEAGSIFAKGALSVSDGINWNIDAAMDRFNLGYFMSDMTSTISGRVSTSGLWKDQTQRIDIDKMSLTGNLNGQPLLARGSLNSTLHLPNDSEAYFDILNASDNSAKVQKVKNIVEHLNASNLLLKLGDNQIIANGNEENLQAKVSFENLSQLGRKFSGSVIGGVTLVQPDGQALPTLYVDLTGDKLLLPGIYLDKAIIQGKVVDLAKSPSKLILKADGLEADESKFENIEVSFTGTEKDHQLTMIADTNSANTDVALKAVIKGGFDRKSQSWNGVVGNGEIATEYVTLSQSQPAQLIASLAGDTPNIKLAAHCWEASSQTGKLCLRENLIASTNQGQINLILQNIDTTLFTPFLPKDISWQADLNGKAVLEWGKGVEPTINATLYSDNGRIGMVQDGYSDPITMPYNRVSLIVRSFDEGIKLRTDIDSGNGARGYADVVVDPYSENKTISGALVLNEFNLAILKPFFPGMRQLAGDITMAGGLGGTLESPVFYGDVNLKQATIATLDLPINLTNINATAKVRGQSAIIEGDFMSGEGTGKLSGTVGWQDELIAKIRVQGERLTLSQPPLLFAEMTPDLNIIVKPLQQYVNIVGAVSIPTATIRPPESNEDVITKSEDVVVLDRELIGNIEEVLAISKPWSINADIGVDLGRDVNFRGFGATIPLAGAVHITQKGQGGMNALGVVQVSRRTTIDAFGQNLELNYGQVRFNGDVTNPRLSIEAAKEIEGKTVGVRIKNNVADPNIVVFNDAGLTQQQAMNALVTGRISNPGATQISEEGFKSEVTNNLAAAGLSLGLSGTRSLTNSIGEAFGLERLTIDASGNSDDTNVNVTGYITPDLYIRYGVGVFNAQSQLSVRYQLTRRVYVEATSSIENAIDVVYSFRF